MKVIQAKKTDLENIMTIIANARTLMRNNGNANQWINGYPSKEIITKDIEKQEAFIIFENNEILGYFAFSKGNDPEPTYNEIEEGKWLNMLPYGVVHRLATSGKRKGIAKTCFNYCFTKTNNIKVDTHRDNLPMKRFFENYGFTYCGTIFVADGSPRAAYQKHNL